MMQSSIKNLFLNRFWYVVFLFLFVSFVVIALLPDEFESKFFDVGQGGCTVVRCPGGPPLLYDAGSAKLPESSEEMQSSRGRSTAPKSALLIDKIAEQLKKYLAADRAVSKIPSTDPYDLNVVISHSDEDHAGLVKSVIQKLRVKLSNVLLRVHYLLGGEEKEFEKYIEIEAGDTIQHTVRRKSTAPGKRVEFEPVDFEPLYCGDVTCHFFAGYRLADSNYRSIIMRLEYGAHSMLLTGDVTGTTTDEILEGDILSRTLGEGDRRALSPEALKVDILQASHHGADSDESNNVGWIKAIDPRYVVFSAGARADSLHPRMSIAQRFLENPTGRLENTGKHHLLRFYEFSTDPLSSFSKDDLFKAFAQEKNRKYIWASTPLGMFNTHEQGTITFSWCSGGDIQVSYDEVGFPTSDSFREHITQLLERSLSSAVRESAGTSLSPVSASMTTVSSSAAAAAAAGSSSFAISSSSSSESSSLFSSLDLSGLDFELDQFKRVSQRITTMTALEKLDLRDSIRLDYWDKEEEVLDALEAITRLPKLSQMFLSEALMPEILGKRPKIAVNFLMKSLGATSNDLVFSEDLLKGLTSMVNEERRK